MAPTAGVIRPAGLVAPTTGAADNIVPTISTIPPSHTYPSPSPLHFVDPTSLDPLAPSSLETHAKFIGFTDLLDLDHCEVFHFGREVKAEELGHRDARASEKGTGSHTRVGDSCTDTGSHARVGDVWKEMEHLGTEEVGTEVGDCRRKADIDKADTSPQPCANICANVLEDPKGGTILEAARWNDGSGGIDLSHVKLLEDKHDGSILEAVRRNDAGTAESAMYSSDRFMSGPKEHRSIDDLFEQSMSAITSSAAHSKHEHEQPTTNRRDTELAISDDPHERLSELSESERFEFEQSGVPRRSATATTTTTTIDDDDRHPLFMGPQTSSRQQMDFRGDSDLVPPTDRPSSGCGHQKGDGASTTGQLFASCASPFSSLRSSSSCARGLAAGLAASGVAVVDGGLAAGLAASEEIDFAGPPSTTDPPVDPRQFSNSEVVIGDVESEAQKPGGDNRDQLKERLRAKRAAARPLPRRAQALRDIPPNEVGVQAVPRRTGRTTQTTVAMTSVGVQSEVSLPEKAIAIWNCRVANDVVVDKHLEEEKSMETEVGTAEVLSKLRDMLQSCQSESANEHDDPRQCRTEVTSEGGLQHELHGPEIGDIDSLDGIVIGHFE